MKVWFCRFNDRKQNSDRIMVRLTLPPDYSVNLVGKASSFDM